MAWIWWLFTDAGQLLIEIILGAIITGVLGWGLWLKFGGKKC